jgi:hypothetical protein
MKVRRRPTRNWEIETLEDRVVPATITVTNLGDTGAGTLRAAIEQSNLDTTQDTITFAPSVTGTITLLTALPRLSTNVILAGPGASSLAVARSVASQTPAFRVFTVDGGVDVGISGLSITSGRELSGGGIANAGRLALTNCSVSGNGAQGAGGGVANTGTLTITKCDMSENMAGSGGGIRNAGQMTISDSTLSGNTAWSGADGAIWNSGTMSLTGCILSGNFAIGGGGIGNNGTMTLTACTLHGNTAGVRGLGGSGGAIVSAGAATLTNCTVSGNFAFGSGGGIENAGMLILSGCTISGNSSSVLYSGGYDGGGGIYNLASVTLADCTLSGNSVVGASIGLDTGGGAIFNAGAMTVSDSTLADNSAGNGDGVYIIDVPFGSRELPKLTTIASIFANPAGGNLALGPGAAFESRGHNLFSDAPVVTLDATDLINTDPLLGSLADNGGPTMTMALLPGSPAIDAGVSVSGVTTDQRGFPRFQGSAPDIGAFEVQLPPTVLIVQRHGVHLKPTTIQVFFNKPMDATSAQDLADYRLVAPRPDHRFGTRDDRVIRIRAAQYDATLDMVTLRPSRRLPLHRTFQLTISGAPPTGLKDTSGLFLDGAGTGHQGTNYVASITARLLAPPIHHNGGKRAAVAKQPSHR